MAIAPGRDVTRRVRRSVPDDEGPLERALEAFLQIVHEPRRQHGDGQCHRTTDVRPDRDPLTGRTARFDLVGETQHDGGPLYRIGTDAADPGERLDVRMTIPAKATRAE